MSTPIVPSISDEQLAELEAIIDASDGNHPQTSLWRSVLARLRAAEADAKRYRWLRNLAGVDGHDGQYEAWILAPGHMMNANDQAETDSAIDSAMLANK